jgi:RNA polymerase sigma factor for flagellar operon FliA
MMDGFQIQEAWKQFKVYGDPQAREQLIRQYAHLVKLTVARVVPYPPNGMEWEDLYSYGVMGLIRAVDMFDPTRNVKFETYAIALIRGAVLEALRSEDWVPRSARDKLRQLERVWVRLEASLGRPPDRRGSCRSARRLRPRLPTTAHRLRPHKHRLAGSVPD